MLTKEELALRVLELEHENKQLIQDFCHIHNIIYGMGGPLNGNTLKFSVPQMKVFWKICSYLHC